MRRVAADANTLVSGALTPAGPAGQVVAAWERGDVILITCAQIILECQEVLRRPRIARKYANVTSETIAASAAVLRTYSVLVDVGDPPRVGESDPDDDALLALRSHEGIPIVTPEQFLAVLRAQPADPGW
jgi:predicted nucleic acid-binding protein